MKIFINRLPIDGPWGGGAKFINAFHELAPQRGITVVKSLRDETVDAVVVVGFDAGNSGVDFYRAFNHCQQTNAKLIVRVNENDARKNTTGVDRTFWNMINLASGVVFVSNWLQQYYVNKFRTSPANRAAVIYNGVDKTTFKPGQRLNDGKVNIVSAHWSDNPLKGQDVTEWLDNFVSEHDDFTFTFIGRTHASLKHSRLIGPLGAIELGDELRRYDVCINATRHDPGPNSVIEPISCGLPTYVHSDGGGAVEFAGTDHVFSDTTKLSEILLSKQYDQNTMTFPSWEQSIGYYLSFINDIVRGT